MSWALSAATTGANVIDVTPLAATLKADQAAANHFFPSTTVPELPTNQLTQQPQYQQPAYQTEESYTGRSVISTYGALSSLPPSQQASARGTTTKPSVSTSELAFTSSTTNVGNTAANAIPASPSAAALAALANAATTPAVTAQLLPLHIQESLKSEIAHLKREALKSEAKFVEKEEAFTKLTEAFHKVQQEKVNEHAKYRLQVKELRKMITEADSRLEFFKHDFHQRKERDLVQVMKNNAAIVENANSMVDAVSETIKRSSTAVISAPKNRKSDSVSNSSSVSSLGLSNISIFNGAGSGVTHEEHLKRVLEEFKAERLAWDQSKAAEMASLKKEFANQMEAHQEHVRKLKLQYTQQYSTWKKQHQTDLNEIDYMSEYLVKLTYLLEEIDRGSYPIASKHGVTSFVIPSKQRTFLKIDHQADVVRSSILGKKLSDLKEAFQRAHIPWNPEQVHLNQSFLQDEKQEEVRLILQGEQQQQLQLRPPSADTRSNQLALPVGASRSSEEEKEQLTQQQREGGLTEEEFHDQFYHELSSHSTIQYIKQLEEERDHYRYLFQKETKNKLEMHHTLTSQNRLLEGSDLFKRSNKEVNSRKNSMTINGQPPQQAFLQQGQQSASMTQLLSSVHAAPHQPHAHARAASLSASISASSQTNDPAALAQSKARDIVQASSTIALNPTAGKLGVQIGFNTKSTSLNTSLDEGVGLLAGQHFGTGIHMSGSMGKLTSPAKIVKHGETSHTHGSYRNANVVRPATAMVRSSNQQQQQEQDSRPISAISAATTSWLGGGSSYPTSVVNTRPGSAAISTRHATPTPAFPLSPQQFAKPTPMHISHGNVAATLYAQQLAKKSHADHHQLLSGIEQSPEQTGRTHTTRSQQPTPRSGRSKSLSARPTTAGRRTIEN